MSNAIFCNAAKRQISRKDCYHSKKDPDCQRCKHLKEKIEPGGYIKSSPKDPREKQKESMPKPKAPAHVSKDTKLPADSIPKVARECLTWEKLESALRPLNEKIGLPLRSEFEQSFTVCLSKKNLVSIRQNLDALRNNGADTLKIAAALALVALKWERKTGGLYEITLDLSAINLNKERAIRNAFALLEKLKPVFPNTPYAQSINIKIAEMQATLERYKPDLQRYLDLALLESCLPHLKDRSSSRPVINYESFHSDDIFVIFPLKEIRHMRKVKAPKQSTPNLWGESIVAIVDELKRIHYSDRKSFIETGKLLNLSYPKIYTHKDPDLVRQRYFYHRRNRKSPPARNKKSRIK